MPFDFFGKEILGSIAFLIGFCGTVVYIVSILKGKTKPHFYTHIVWFILGAVAFGAQIHDGAGPGAWATGLTTASCFVTSMLALKWGEKNITRGDRIALAAALIAIIPWALTNNPLGSVILISLIEIVAFYPTVRKSWNKPHEENLTAYNLGTIKLGLSLLALSNVTWNTALYTGVNVLINSSFVIMCMIRRRTKNSLLIQEGI